MKPPIRITHIITDLAMGGAEMMLYKLLGGMDRDEFSSQVISLTGGGIIADRIRALGISVHQLDMRPGLPNPFALLQLSNLIRNDHPNLVQTWMYHADLLGGVAAWVAGRIPVIWNIRNSTLDPVHTRRSTHRVVKACAKLSGILPKSIISCSHMALEIHRAVGYKSKNMLVIPNGFDLTKFFPLPEAHTSVRAELGLNDETCLIGYIARFDPQKDHQTFIKSARIFSIRKPGFHFLLCGEGVDWENKELEGWINQEGLRGNFHLLGRRDDIPRLNSALDLAVVSSAYGEAFSNVIGEAMACEIPCVVTDVGDSGEIVGKTGRVVPPANPLAMAQAWLDILDLPSEERRMMGKAARQRIETHFSLPAIIHQYTELYHRMLD